MDIRVMRRLGVFQLAALDGFVFDARLSIFSLTFCRTACKNRLNIVRKL